MGRRAPVWLDLSPVFVPVGEKHLNQTRQKGSARLLTWFADGVLDARHLSCSKLA